jgi:hypothetical protein
MYQWDPRVDVAKVCKHNGIQVCTFWKDRILICKAGISVVLRSFAFSTPLCGRRDSFFVDITCSYKLWKLSHK